MKQKAYPVFFITNAGKVPMSDMEVRAASIQVAVKFAQRWHLAGVVFACDGLLLCPRLFGYLKARGLLCATYGSSNNEPAMVKVSLSHLTNMTRMVTDRAYNDSCKPRQG